MSLGSWYGPVVKRSIALRRLEGTLSSWSTTIVRLLKRRTLARCRLFIGGWLTLCFGNLKVYHTAFDFGDAKSFMSTIHVVGSINQDIVVRVSRPPQTGETVIGETVEFVPGGKGANQAVAAKRFAAEVWLTGCVGDDAFGNELISYLQSTGVCLNVAVASDVASGTALILVDDQGQNRITVVPGANHRIDLANWPASATLGPRDCVLLQNEIPIDRSREVLRLAHRSKATTLWNVAPSTTVPLEWLRDVDYLILNEQEFGDIFGEPLSANREETLRCRRAQVPCNLLLTLGDRGAMLATEQEVLVVSGKTVEVRDTTGAGDCFVGAFAAQMANGMDLFQSLEFANTAAALSVTRPGASPSFPCRQDVQTLMM